MQGSLLSRALSLSLSQGDVEEAAVSFAPVLNIPEVDP
jgi:hypothetical protein